MSLISRALLVLLPVGYFAVARSYAAEFRGEPGAEERPRLRRILLASVVAAHLVWFATQAWHGALFAVSTGAQASSALACALAAVYAWVEWRTAVRHLGVFVLSAVFAFQAAASIAMDESGATAASARNPLFLVHVITIVIALATLLLSGFFGLVYLVLERQMRRQTFGLLFGLPALRLSGVYLALATFGLAVSISGLRILVSGS